MFPTQVSIVASLSWLEYDWIIPRKHPSNVSNDKSYLANAKIAVPRRMMERIHKVTERIISTVLSESPSPKEEEV